MAPSGVAARRNVYTWHLTFEHAQNLHEHVWRYQEALTGSRLHLVPPEWLHLTMQALGFTDEISDTDRDAAVRSVSTAVRPLQAFTLTFGPPTVRTEAIAIHPTPDEPCTNCGPPSAPGLPTHSAVTPSAPDPSRPGGSSRM